MWRRPFVSSSKSLRSIFYSRSIGMTLPSLHSEWVCGGWECRTAGLPTINILGRNIHCFTLSAINVLTPPTASSQGVGSLSVLHIWLLLTMQCISDSFFIFSPYLTPSLSAVHIWLLFFSPYLTPSLLVFHIWLYPSLQFLSKSFSLSSPYLTHSLYL